jgi:hypothetical protein
VTAYQQDRQTGEVMVSPKKGASAAKDAKSPTPGATGNQTSSTAGLKVTAILDGFCRAGLSWSDRPTFVRVSDLTEEQIAEMKRCPGLTVVDVELEDEAADEFTESTDDEQQGEQQ